MELKINMEFICPQCNTTVQHDYTEKDILNNDYLDFTCQGCNYSEQVKTSIIIDKAKQEAIKGLKKILK